MKQIKPTPQASNYLIANHTSNYRSVRINGDHTVADVFSIRRSSKEGDPDYQTTYQDPSEGRFSLTCIKGSHSIRVIDLIGDVMLAGEAKSNVLASIPPIIAEWLLDINHMRHSNYIPSGYGWDGKFTRAEYQKRQRANFLFISRDGETKNMPKEWLDEVLDEICRTPKSFLTLRWDLAKDIPDDRLIHIDNTIIKKEVIFIYDNGDHELQKTKRIVGDTTKHPGIKIPSNVSRLIILTRGVTCDEQGNLVGCGVEMYREDFNKVSVWKV